MILEKKKLSDYLKASRSMVNKKIIYLFQILFV